ncbi:AarF/ABC1/UbiB kinase family protein [Candidatus Uhrbacteria bacterium]|nr:MAG: AarF/ABC1/UbiB kinase family protein [Candidatus Uhrbacteria bacterium]
MPTPTLRRVNVRRVREIIGVFYEIGFGLLIRQLQLQKHLPLRLRLMGRFRLPKNADVSIEDLHAEEWRRLPVRLRLGFEKLGPTFVKFGQILSLRADLVGPEIANELRKLQDEVPALPFSELEAVLKRELKQPVQLAFKTLSPKCIGSASLAQVYRGRLRNGADVAVKILRPGIDKTIGEDILILQWLARLLEERISTARSLRPTRVVDEFAEWTMRELDLLNEATHIAHFRSLLSDEERFYIPDVHWTYTTPHVLTMEFSRGVRPDDHKALKKLGVSRKELARTGVRLAFRQFFELGLFHGDPHPGNFFVLKNGVLCLHDFGIVGRISDATRRELIGCFLAFLDKDADAAIKHLLHIAEPERGADHRRFAADTKARLERWFYAPTPGRRLSQTFYDVIISGAGMGVAFPTEVVLLAKAIITMESMALDLDPKFDIINELRPYLDRAIKIELEPGRLARRTRDAALDANALLDDLPEAARHLIRLAKQERVEVRLNADEFHAITQEIDRQTDVRILSLVFVAVLLASSVLLHLQGVTHILGIPLATFGILASVMLGVIVFFKIRKGAA